MQGGTWPTVKFNATRRAVAIVFSRRRTSIFFDESERCLCAKPAVNINAINGPKPENDKPD